MHVCILPLLTCVDAHFAIAVEGVPGPSSTPTNPLEKGHNSNPPKQYYMCVADGVGSWRQYGIDPRQFSHGLVYEYI